MIKAYRVDDAGNILIDVLGQPIVDYLPARLINGIPRLCVDTEITDVTITGDVIVENIRTGQYNATLPTILDTKDFIAQGSNKGILFNAITNGVNANPVTVAAPNGAAMSYGLDVMPARYMNTPPTLTDTYASPLLLDSTGKLLISAGNTEYVDDGTGFTVATSKGTAMMGLATSDAVDANDIGILRMTVNRNLGVDISEQSLTAVKVSKDTSANAAGNPIYTQLSNGTAVLTTHDATELVIDDVNTKLGVQTSSLLYGYDSTGAAETWRALHVDASGNVILSSDIQIGAVELKDGANDYRASILAPNTAAMTYGLETMPARYMLTPPTLTDTFASPLLLDSTGNLMIAGTVIIDDSTPPKVDCNSSKVDCDNTEVDISDDATRVVGKVDCNGSNVVVTSSPAASYTTDSIVAHIDGTDNIIDCNGSDVVVTSSPAASYTTDSIVAHIDGTDNIVDCNGSDVVVTGAPAVSNATDNILIYGLNGTTNYPIATDTAGNIVIADGSIVDCDGSNVVVTSSPAAAYTTDSITTHFDGTDNKVDCNGTDVVVTSSPAADESTDSIVIYANTAKDGAGTNYVPLVDADGHLQVDVLGSPAADYTTDSVRAYPPLYNSGYATADTQIKASAGFVHNITIASIGTTVAGLLTIYDSLTETGTIIYQEAIGTGVLPHTVTLDVACATGIFVGFDASLDVIGVTVGYL